MIRTNRGSIHFDAERDLKRAIDGMIRGTISEAEGDQIIPELRRQRDRVKAALASAAKPPKVIELHPPSVDDYLRAIERLADYANGHLAKSDDELARSLRRLIDSVMVMPAESVLRSLKPDLNTLARIETRGLVITPRHAAIDVHFCETPSIRFDIDDFEDRTNASQRGKYIKLPEIAPFRWGKPRSDMLSHLEQKKVVTGHLRRILSKYARYYNEVRTQLSLGKDASCTRPIERFGDIIAQPGRMFW
jgi:hypothetical protein